MTMRYSHPSGEYKRQALAKLPAFGNLESKSPKNPPQRPKAKVVGFGKQQIRKDRLGGGTGRRTGLKNTLQRVFNNIRDLSKTTENIVQTHDWRGFLADLRSENGVKRTKIHRRHIGDTNCLSGALQRTIGRHSCGHLYI
jgi:hypothetical protein